MWRATVLTLFPEMFPGPLGVSHFKLTRAVFGRERAVALHGERIFGEGPQFYCAAHAMCGADPGDADVGRHRPVALTSWRRQRQQPRQR